MLSGMKFRIIFSSGTIVPSSPTEVTQSDASVKKLQAFFAQGEPVRKEAVVT